MKFIAKEFNELTTTELYKILKARAAIFVVEQKCIYQDLDDMDFVSFHMYFEEKGEILAYLRAFWMDEKQDTLKIGRVLTLEHGKGYGGRLLHEALTAIRYYMMPRRVYVDAQSYAAGFYAREGFQVCTEEFIEDGIPHVGMELK